MVRTAGGVIDPVDGIDPADQLHDYRMHGLPLARADEPVNVPTRRFARQAMTPQAAFRFTWFRL
jgi:hypothetical protein